ncbi:MAG: 2-oxoglutarate dehydrogenase, E2 component, dihydrolipoamide succinyltransferase [Actinomycetota bacterium]|nr:2-oxoglutarate dehydrogenase, E2 component, dihydrolipoamide succinyltransferase [Actinomycetota bacterium]
MTFSVTMPQLGESVTEGTVTRWLKQVGDIVAADEPLLEVSTDKVDTEIPAPASGVLLAIRAQEDETVLVGAELAVIGEASDEPAPAAAPAAPIVTPASTQGVTEISITLPALGESVTEGTVTRWLKQVGDQVEADEPIVEISTDKVDTEIPAPASGTLVAITVDEDQTVAVGSELGRIATGASTPEAAAPPEAAPEVAEPSDAYVTPLVRRLAAQNDIDLATLTGTGVGGRIRKQDVLDAAQQKAAPVAAAAAAPVSAAPVTAASPPASPLRGRTEKIPRLRKVIAERLVESLQTSAQLTTVIEVDVSRIAILRNRVKGEFEAREGVKLTFLPFFCKAAIEALKQFPQVNASINMDEGTITYHDSENLGIAVDTERGLLVPVLQRAGDLNIAGLARNIADVADRTRTNKVSPNELSGGTFTVTNTGSRGALFDTPIINLPQVAILGTGAVVKRPIVVTDTTGQDVIAIRSMVYLSLSYDHRLIDGADAARFLGTIRQRLEEASFEAELGL